MKKLILLIAILLPLPALAARPPVLLSVPFTSQAPDFNWSNSYYQNGCEEAAVLMAIYWTRSKTNTNITVAAAKKDILAMSKFEEKNYGLAVDTNAEDTADRLLGAFYHYHDYQVIHATSTSMIVRALEQGRLVLAPTNGRLLHNPHYRTPGPPEHFLVIKGYDYVKKQFITNDSGTRYGLDYRYPEQVLFNALREYPTGNHLPIINSDRKMLIIISR